MTTTNTAKKGKARDTKFTDTFYYSSELKRVAEMKNLRERYTMTDEHTQNRNRIYTYELLKGERIVFTSKAIELTTSKGVPYFAVYKKAEDAQPKPHVITENETELLALLED